MSTPIDYVPDDVLIEQYCDPKQTMDSLCAFYGVSMGQLYSRLSSNAELLTRAQTIKARRLHELSIQALFIEPETISDKDGNSRIDPSSVTLIKMRADGLSRMAGILDARLSERTQVDVNVTASPLADHLSRIAAAGSSIPIAAQGRVIEGEAVDISPEVLPISHT